ncbi:hypothetical protein BP6252_02967 [Coleophoma cylindrospora]|uniref:Oxidase ustYa n=1 Tax=Coleophoma cylindrospora TaxID=1849047 RepID=A0A3D8S6B1_9HELO|nr:hypothetical protein BP6252_02967 [Coleophoma cylindrospora]
MDTKKIYKNTPEMDDREQLMGESDNDSASTTDEKDWSSPGFRGLRQSRGQRFISKLRDWWWLYTTGILILIAGLQLAILHEIKTRTPGSSRQAGGDYTNEGPIFTTEVVQWAADPEFTPLNASAFLAPKTQAKWESLLPAGAGFVGGPDSIVVYNSTSVTHQLHCVYIMGKIFSAVVTKSPSIPEPEDYEAHFLHCVDYMRQAAMCAGDVAIEPRGVNGQPAEVTLENAFNGLHVCKDYSQVKSYLEEQLKDGVRNILPLDD